MTAEVFVAGALHLDVIVDAPALPRLDETVVGRGVAYRFGGKGGNQAVAAARMGARTAMAGRVGSDQFGAQILAELDAAGVGRDQVLTVEGASGMSVAIVEDAGSYGAVIVSGVNRAIGDPPVRLPEGVSVLLLQNEIPEAANLSVARQAGDGTLVVLNAAPARITSEDLLRRTGLLIANRIEASVLTGGDGALDDPAAAAQRLLALGPGAVIVTLGADGYVACQSGGEVIFEPGHRVEVISTHGAGDAFVGALAARLAKGEGIGAAARFAQGAAALHVSTPVAERSSITPADVAAFLGS